MHPPRLYDMDGRAARPRDGWLFWNDPEFEGDTATAYFDRRVPLSDGGCWRLIGDAGGTVGRAGFAFGFSMGKSGLGAPGGAPRIGVRAIQVFPAI